MLTPTMQCVLLPTRLDCVGRENDTGLRFGRSRLFGPKTKALENVTKIALFQTP